MSQGFAPPPSGAPQFQAPAPQQPPRPYAPVADAPVVQAQPFPSQATRPPAPPTVPGLPQRPAVIALACSLAVVASLLWVCGLSLLWVTAVIGTGTFAQIGDNGAVFHILNRFNYRMLDGLAVPLYLFPLASFTTGFLILSRRRWTRTLHTAVGLVALAWAAWWLQDNLLWWFSAAWYVVVACLVLWTPGATAWYRWHPSEQARPHP
jgi:hypothetical protein